MMGAQSTDAGDDVARERHLVEDLPVRLRLGR